MKILRHKRDKVGDYQERVLMHVPIGALAGIPLLGKTVEKLFIQYEENEDLHTKDQAWKDYAGALVGAIAVELILIGLVIWAVSKILGLLTGEL